MLLANFYPFVATEVIGCPNPVIDQALRLTAIEYCRETKCWAEFQDPITLFDGAREYDMDVPTGAYVQTVRDVLIGSRRLQPVTMLGLQEVMPDWPTATASEPSYYNLAGELPRLRVYPTPASPTQAMLVRAVYVPTLSATTLPDFLAQRHLEAISSGTKGRLLAMPGVPWSNPELGMYHRANFDKAILNTRIEEAHDRVPGTIRVQPRSFGF